MAAAGSDSPKKKRTADDNIKRHKHVSRQSRMELSKADMLQLLSHLETELQARDHVIATLKAEKAKHFLYQAKYGRFSLSDPLYALQRDSEADRDAAMRAMYDDPLTQLDKLICTQHEAQKQMKEQLQVIDKRYYKICTELEEEKWKHNHDLEQGDSVVFMLEKDRERLQHEVELERKQNRTVETEVQSVSNDLAKFARHREVVLKLIKKRSQILNDLSETQSSIVSLEEALQKAEADAQQTEERQAEECSKCLHIEAVAEQQLGVASMEREQLLSRLSLIERQNRELYVELERLRSAIGPRSRHSQAPVASDGIAVINLNSSGLASPTKHTLASPADTRVHSSSTTGDARLPHAKAVAHVTPIGVVPQSRVVEASRTGTVTEVNAGSKFVAGHQVVLAKPTDIRMPPVIELGSASSPGVVSMTTTSGTRISIAVSGSSNQPRKPMPAVAGRVVPPPVPPNKPQVSITQPRLPTAPHVGGSGRAIPNAQPSKPQPQAKYGLAFSQDRMSVPDSKPILTASGATSRQPAAPSSQTGTSSHIAMVVGETSTVHKHPSQVCVNIK